MRERNGIYKVDEGRPGQSGRVTEKEKEREKEKEKGRKEPQGFLLFETPFLLRGKYKEIFFFL